MNKGWSPEQIAGKMKCMKSIAPSDPDDLVKEQFQVSHETIYAHIYPL